MGTWDNSMCNAYIWNVCFLVGHTAPKVCMSHGGQHTRRLAWLKPSVTILITSMALITRHILIKDHNFSHICSKICSGDEIHQRWVKNQCFGKLIYLWNTNFQLNMVYLPSARILVHLFSTKASDLTPSTSYDDLPVTGCYLNVLQRVQTSLALWEILPCSCRDTASLLNDCVHVTPELLNNVKYKEGYTIFTHRHWPSRGRERWCNTQ
jgi:hypothetical protein